MLRILNDILPAKQAPKFFDNVRATIGSELCQLSFFALAGCLMFHACNNGTTRTETTWSPADSARVVAKVEAATWAFHAADTARNAEAIVNLLWPEYSMLVDGSYLTYDQVVAGSRDFMASLALFHTEWTSLRVVPLGQDAGVASFAFRDSIVTRGGELIRNQGTTSFVWQRRGADWRVIYADANHRLITP